MRKDTLSLIVATILWGITFVVVKKGVEAYHPVSFLFLRFSITFLVLTVFMALTKRKIKNEIFVKGLILGIFLFFGYILQTVGLKYTTPSKSAFLTSLFVLFTPFISFFILKTKIKFRTVLAVILASAGIYLMFGLSIDTINIGDILTILCAVSWAFHIVFVGL
ncbi:MAG: EamA/RhaT family transporter, partial [Caldiserica bacterium]